MHPIGQCRLFDCSSVAVDTLKWSDDMRIAIATLKSIKILYPCLNLPSSGISAVKSTPTTSASATPSADDADESLPALSIDDTFILFEGCDDDETTLKCVKYLDKLPSEYENDADFRYSSIASQGFKRCVWSNLGLADNGGCLLLTISVAGHVAVWTTSGNAKHGTYHKVCDVTDALCNTPKSFLKITCREMLEIQCASWKNDLLCLGAKSGHLYILDRQFNLLAWKRVFGESGADDDQNWGEWITAIAQPSGGASEDLIVAASSSGQIKVVSLNKSGDGDECELRDELTFGQQDFTNIQILEIVNDRLFIARGSQMQVVDFNRSKDDPMYAIVRGICAFPQGSNISSMQPVTSSLVYIFTQTGECGAVAERENGFWEFDADLSCDLHGSLLPILDSELEDDNEDDDQRQEDQQKDAKSPQNHMGMYDYLRPISLNNGRQFPKFMGVRMSPNCMYAACCFDLSWVKSAIYKPNNDERISFALIQLSCKDQITGSIRSAGNDLLYFQLWDVLASMSRKDSTDWILNLSKLTLSSSGTSDDDEYSEILRRKIQNFLVPGSSSSIPLDSTTSTNHFCPMCETDELILKADEGNKIYFECKEKHKFTSCVVSKQPITSFVDYVECLWCEKARLKSSSAPSAPCTYCSSSLCHNPI